MVFVTELRDPCRECHDPMAWHLTDMHPSAHVGGQWCHCERKPVLVDDTEALNGYWRSVLRSLGALPITCSDCEGRGTVNSADTEPCETCAGSGSDWMMPGRVDPYGLPKSRGRSRRLPSPEPA